MNRVGRRAFTLRNSLLAAFGAFGASAGLVGALRSFANFEQALIGVQKTTDISGAALARFGEDVQRMSRTIPVAANELLGLAENAGQLGITGTDNLLKFTETVAKLGLTTNLTAEQAAFSLARIANITAFPIEEIDRLGSVIVELGNNFAATEVEIVSLATRIARATVSFKLGAANVFGLAAAMAAVGVRAEEGGGVILRAFQAIDTAIRETGDELKLLSALTQIAGEDLEDAFNTDPTQVFQALIEGLGRFSESGGSIAQALEAMGLEGIRVVSVLSTLAERADLVGDAFDSSNAEIERNTAATIEFDRRAASFISQMQRVRNAVLEAAVVIGEKFAPAILEAAEDFRDFILAAKDTGQIEATAERMADSFRNVVNSIKDLADRAAPLFRALGNAILFAADNVGILIIAIEVLIALKLALFLVSVVAGFKAVGLAALAADAAVASFVGTVTVFVVGGSLAAWVTGMVAAAGGLATLAAKVTIVIFILFSFIRLIVEIIRFLGQLNREIEGVGNGWEFFGVLIDVVADRIINKVKLIGLAFVAMATASQRALRFDISGARAALNELGGLVSQIIEPTFVGVESETTRRIVEGAQQRAAADETRVTANAAAVAGLGQVQTNVAFPGVELPDDEPDQRQIFNRPFNISGGGVFDSLAEGLRPRPVVSVVQNLGSVAPEQVAETPDPAASNAVVAGLVARGLGDGDGDSATTQTVDQLRGSFRALQDQIDPLGAVTRQFTDDQKLLDDALTNLDEVTIPIHRDLLEQLRVQYEINRDPVAQLRAALDQERQALSLTSDQREVNNQVLQIAADLEAAGVQNSMEAAEGFRGQLTALQDLNEQMQIREQILDRINGPQERFNRQMRELNFLLGLNEISLMKFNRLARDELITLLADETDVTSGLRRGFAQLQNEVEDFASTSQELLVGAFREGQDALKDFARTGKLELGDLFAFISDKLIELGTQQLATAVFGGGGGGGGGFLSNLFGGGGGGGLFGGGSSANTASGAFERVVPGAASSATSAVSSAGGGFIDSIIGGIGSAVSGIGSFLGGLLPFQRGGELDVSAATSVATIPGVDNRVMMFRAQDRERITITPRSEVETTLGRQMAVGGGGLIDRMIGGASGVFGDLPRLANMSGVERLFPGLPARGEASALGIDERLAELQERTEVSLADILPDTIPGFQTGGSFDVSSSTSLATLSGADNRLIAFGAKDGERVTVRAAGTRDDERGQQAQPITLINNWNIATPNPDNIRSTRTQLTNLGSDIIQRGLRRR